MEEIKKDFMEQMTSEIPCRSCHRKDKAWDVSQEETVSGGAVRDQRVYTVILKHRGGPSVQG